MTEWRAADLRDDVVRLEPWGEHGTDGTRDAASFVRYRATSGL